MNRFTSTAAAAASSDSVNTKMLKKTTDPASDTGIKVSQPTRLQKRLLLSAISLLGRFRQRKGSVLMLTSDLCVKYGRRLDFAEAQTMIYIAKHTSIPVPKVHFAFTHDACTYILMERINGQMIGMGWVNRPQESRVKLLESLKEMIVQMRTLHTERSAICSVNGGSLYDPRMPCSTGRFGPFDNVQHFHSYLRNDIHDHVSLDQEVKDLIAAHSRHWDGPTFTHGDLSSLNILVRGDTIVGIIDWETAGWYPSYWEYTTACQVNPQNSFWIDEIDKFLKAEPEALAMERLRQKYFGDF